MKRILLASAFVCGIFFLPSSTFSQSFRFAIHAGSNMSKLDGKSFKDEYGLGYHLGVAPEIMFSKKWGIQPEVVFNQSNLRTSTVFSDMYKVSSSDLKNVSLNYLSVPLFLSFRPVSFLTFQAGPQFSVLMSRQRTLLENGGDAFRKGDFSMVGGAQLNIFRLRVYGRYAIGLSELNDIDRQDRWRSETFQLGVGFAL